MFDVKDMPGQKKTKLDPCSSDAPTVCGREAAKKKHTGVQRKAKGFHILIAIGRKK